MDEGPSEECEVCGGTDFYKEAGHFYCNECQTQSQQISEQVFEREEATISKQATRKIHKDKNQKLEDKLTSWECYNIILKGLTDELICLGAKPEIKPVVRCLWMKYLYKCEVFDLKSNRPPKVSILGSRKDVEILYNVKRRKRKRSGMSSISTNLSDRRKRAKKRRALIKSQYEELSQSQSLTQDSSMVGETLSSLKSGSEKSENSAEIGYNRYSTAQLKRIMSNRHQKEHKQDVTREMSCHKFSVRSFPGAFVRGPTVLTSFTLYSILYIALLIVEDPVQLGDILRFLREGHLSFGSYRHFFDEDMSEKSLNLPRKNEKLYSSESFRQRAASLVHFLKIEEYIKTPNLVQLCSRYCTELNLPRTIFICVEKFILKSTPRMQFGKKSSEIPNYEGRALSFILFTLKLLFSLDGVTEDRLSHYAKVLNDHLANDKMFDILEWLKYIGYRDIVVATYHMPSSLQNCKNIDSDMYLNYLKNQEVKYKSASKNIQKETKDYLNIFEKLIDGDHDKFTDEIRFENSLTPFLGYVSTILSSKGIECEEHILKHTFGEDSLDFLLRPNEYLKLVRNETTKNGAANDNIIIEDVLHIDKYLNDHRNKTRNPVTVRVSDEIQGDKFIKEYLEVNKRTSFQSTDVGVFLSDWQKANKEQFSKNQVFLQIASENVKVRVKDGAGNTDVYPEHFNAFERYWLNIPTNPTNVRRYISKSRVQQIISKLSHSFRIILKEFKRIVEQDVYDFYSEFLVTELNLVYFGGYCSKGKTGKVPGLQKVIKDCRKKW